MNINNNNFLFLLKYDDDYKELIFNGTLDNLKEAYIICKYSFKDQNFNIDKFLLDKYDMRISEIIKLNFTFNEIMQFKNKKIDFYIISKKSLQRIFKKKGVNTELSTYIYFIDKMENKLLYFEKENKMICFKIKNILNPNDIIHSNTLSMNKEINKGNNIFINKSYNINDNLTKNHLYESNTYNFGQINDDKKYSNLIAENKKLKGELDYYKNLTKKLKAKNDELSNENYRLNNKLFNTSKTISNFSNNNLQQNNNAINNLIDMLKTKDKEISDLKLKLQKAGKDKKLIDFNDIIVINFISADQKINTGIQCLKTETFAEVEERLYQKYERFRETNNNFISNGGIILRFKMICENNLQDGDKVQLLTI